MVAPQKPARSVLSDDELMAAIRRDLRAIYSDVIREPLPEKLAAALNRLELRSRLDPLVKGCGALPIRPRATRAAF